MTASIEKVSGRLRGRVVLTRGGERVGERGLDASNDCASVANALALTVAVAIDTLDVPEAAPPLVAPPLAAPPLAPPARVPPPAEPPPLAPKPKETVAAPVAFRLSGAPKVSGGIAPAAAFGAAVAASVRWNSVSLGLEARGDLPAFAPLSTGGDLGTSVVLGMLVPCVHLRRFVACGLVAAGSMRGESRGVENFASAYGFYGAAGARVGLEIPLSRAVALRPELDGFVAWARPGLRFNDRTVWTAPPVAGTFGLALVLELGGSGF